MVIATRSHLLPPEDACADSNAAMDMVLNMDHPTQLSTTQDSPWDAWCEESIIEVSEIWLNKPGLPTSKFIVNTSKSPGLILFLSDCFM